MRAAYHASRGQTEIIDKTKGKIKQAVGDLTGDKRLTRESDRDERKVESKAR